MLSQSKQNIFSALEQAKHRVNENATPSLFPTDTELNDTEYWLFSDLYNIFGSSYTGTARELPINITEQTSMFNDFEKMPHTPEGPKNFFEFCNNHIVCIKNDYSLDSDKKLNAPDARITRYACWALMKQHPNRIFSQLYFMMPDISFKNLYNASYKFSRIYQRSEMGIVDMIANGIAYRNHADMRAFNRALHRAFFYSASADKIRDFYKISGSVFNYMGTQSLLARRLALRRAIDRYDANPQMSFDTFLNTACVELGNERTKMISRTNRAPEHDISRTSISNLTTELKKMEHAFKQKFMPQKLR